MSHEVRLNGHDGQNRLIFPVIREKIIKIKIIN